MFGSTRNSAQAYASVGMQTEVIAGSPHKLIAILLEGAMLDILKARKYMQSGEVMEKGKSINHAITIIDSGLRASLNLKEGGDISINLSSLYSYMTQKLSEAHLRNDPKMLQEVYKLLSELKVTWDAIDPKHHQSNATAMEV